MKTLTRVIEKRLESNKAKTIFTFLKDGEKIERSVSLVEIRKKSLTLLRMLQKKTAVIIVLPQGISFIEAFLGCLYAQAIAIPLAIPNKNSGIENFQAIARDANVSFGITNRQTLANLRKWFGADALAKICEWILVEDVEADTSDFSLPELAKPNDIAFLQYTSGSTAKPKAVVVTHENIVANSEIIQKCFQNNAETVSVCWLPSFHDMGLIDGIVQPIFSNFQSVLMTPTHFLQKPIRWFKAITEYKGTYSGAPNFAFDFCVNRIKDEELNDVDLSSLRCLYNGSEPIRPQTMRKFFERFAVVGFSENKLFTCYGLAEATLAVTTSKLGSKPSVIKVDEKHFRQNQILLTETELSVELVGCGFAYLDTGLKIVNPDTLEECTERETGEIWVSGKSVTAGYLNAPEINGENFVTRDGTRFLRTGDLGFLLNGELFVAGRIKDLIILRGKNHYPQDIEQTTFSSHQALQTNACAAFSIEIDAEEKLVIVQELKRAFRRIADYNSIFNQAMTEISQRHGVAPHDLVLVSPNTLPKTTSGKIQRGKCRELWHSQQLNALAFLREYLYYGKN